VFIFLLLLAEFDDINIYAFSLQVELILGGQIKRHCTYNIIILNLRKCLEEKVYKFMQKNDVRI